MFRQGQWKYHTTMLHIAMVLIITYIIIYTLSHRSLALLLAWLTEGWLSLIVSEVNWWREDWSQEDDVLCAAAAAAAARAIATLFARTREAVKRGLFREMLWREVKWTFKLLRREKHRPQPTYPHWNGFSPVWVISCRFTFVASAKAFPHDRYRHLYGFSPVWIR